MSQRRNTVGDETDEDIMQFCGDCGWSGADYHACQATGAMNGPQDDAENISTESSEISAHRAEHGKPPLSDAETIERLRAKVKYLDERLEHLKQLGLVSLVDQNEALIRRIRDLRGGNHSRALAMMAWFAARGANNAGQWPGDPKDFEKQNQAREDFDKWWGPS